MTKNILNKHYPILLNRWKLTILVSIFISFFLSVFQPFGLQFVEIDYKTIVLIGYGVVTLLILLIDLFLIPLLLKKSFRNENWTVWKQIIWLTFIILTISIGNYVYSIVFSIFQWVGLRGFLIFILFTLPIAIIPITAITFITQNIYLKRNLKLSAQINEELKEKTTDNDSSELISFKSGLQEYSFPFSTILFLESEGNYVQVYYIKNKQIKTQLIRNTLKNISAEIHKKELFKCHRAFMININNVEEVKGNSHGISITLKQIDKQIPVSRSNTKAFTKLFNATNK
jgi:low affinity Fe/Cu permease